jgi:hypothetical protein
MIVARWGAAMAVRYPRGTHLGVRGNLYDHHGIYWGWGQVIHHSGLSNGLSKGPIEKTSLVDFVDDGDVFIVEHDGPSPWREIIARAEQALEEADHPKWAYDVARQNCEHFANWCVTGSKSSSQVRRMVAIGPVGTAIRKWFEGT